MQEGCRLTQIFWDEFITAVHDKDPPDVEFDVVLFLLVFKKVKWGPTGDEEERPELQLPLHREMLGRTSKPVSP